MSPERASGTNCFFPSDLKGENRTRRRYALGREGCACFGRSKEKSNSELVPQDVNDSGGRDPENGGLWGRLLYTTESPASPQFPQTARSRQSSQDLRAGGHFASRSALAARWVVHDWSAGLRPRIKEPLARSLVARSVRDGDGVRAWCGNAPHG